MSTELNTTCNSGRQDFLETAFATAVELIAEMDKSLFSSDGMVFVVPDVILWMMSKTSPDVMAKVECYGLRRELVSLLTDYAALRRGAQQTLFVPGTHCNGDTDEQALLRTRITFDDLLYALENEAGSRISATFHHAFNAILPVVEETLQGIDEILWGDEEPVSLRKEGTHSDEDTTRAPLFDHYEEYRIVVERGDAGGYCADTLNSAILWFEETLAAMDDGRHPGFWSTVYTSILGEMLQTDSPDFAECVQRDGLIPAFYEAAASYVSTMRNVERQWSRLSEPLRALLSAHTADDDEAVDIIASMLDPGGHDGTARDLKARYVYEMFCRRLNPERTTTTCELVLSATTNAVIDRIKRDVTSWQTCYLVDAPALPEPLATRITERQCIVVRLPEDRLRLLSELTRDTGLSHIISRMSDGSQSRVSLTVNHAFWAPKPQLWPLMFRFRKAIPVLYIFESCCALVQYRFNHFVDLRRIADVPGRHIPSATLNEDDWRHAAAHYVSTLPDGRQVKPAMMTRLEDLTTYPQLSDWPSAIA
ncbi:hypothetical protein [Paraburkholderia sp. GAS42]|uniref:hypothetical protein n=1 Tax=Paraburkholderia sp. GAS42 TaxID=3035135 RepID=UPI003D248351